MKIIVSWSLNLKLKGKTIVEKYVYFFCESYAWQIFLHPSLVSAAYFKNSKEC